MQFIDAEAVHRLLDYPSLIAALREAHRMNAMPASQALVMDEPGAGENKFVSLLAWAGGDVVASKLVGVFPGNLSLREPQPSVQGLVALFDGRTGAPLGVCDGTSLTFRKTAADSALGASFLARQDAEVLLVLGAGGLAPHVIEAHRAARPSLRRVLVWNRTMQRAEALVAELGPAVEAEAVIDLDAALGEADIVSAVTMATVPIIRGARLKPGAHVDLIGAYRPDMREADDDVVRRARLFVDTRSGCTGSGEIADPLARGLISIDDIEADLFELCAGTHEGRRSPDEITMFKNVGGAHLDLFTARHLLARARADG
ncbi:bifunctional Delta(1)-pyrroline-2-carboxylate/Delta(1)-piperideine-2-carboxylate reductase [Aureimonas psammosilenae]|uniref:ornithine cyclodeaminase family protein n=1 Tax=Aureimonas psammosilenae TaxID=2495496 RepID=UPI001260F926|nr:ornithine cyclodeaminase family protein [Aureimonas psammosilenae]